ncbi:MAG TPA: phosphoribosylformylglycinamidine cyclo-ligase [Ktedonobacteraceae bacterium]|nr:phosphoribosylformylglycinamidine cyclo-ligase [Ktedonobacteraceae bacterium]
MSYTANYLRQNVGMGLAPTLPHPANRGLGTASTLPPTPRALVLRAPGINCDRETAQACRLAGFQTDLLHINQLLMTPEHLLDYHLLVIPGGFSYGDDLGAGTLLAKNLVIHLKKQLQQFIDESRLVLGICNGFQVLVRAGLLPGIENASLDTSQVPTTSLISNASGQFECRWVTLSTQTSPCIFTQGIDHSIELPVAHGEGRFVLADPDLLSILQSRGQIPLVYSVKAWQRSPSPATPSFSSYLPYPDNPNGSVGNVAGVCNFQGNVLGLMPHPERYTHALQHPQRRGAQGDGDGLLLFKNAYEYVNKTFHAQTSYASSGVDIAAADTAKELMQQAVRAMQGPEVLAGIGAFAGIYDLSRVRNMHSPALVASTDGVGTKTLIAAQAGRFETIGYDLVNHSVNDLLTQGATPLFFMDYLAMGKLDPIHAATIVKSVAMACQEVGCALLGGETAEMPDVYLPGAFDLAGTMVGIVEQDAIIGGNKNISAGDLLVGLPSNGLHTNGYSLARRVFAPFALDTIFPELEEPLVDVLLRPHRCYLREIQSLCQYSGITVKGIAHITGGSFEGNIARILPPGIQAVVETDSWQVPPIFDLIGRLGSVTRKEMFRTFNMGVGMVCIVSSEAAEKAQDLFPELFRVGYITEGEGVILHGN